MKLDIEKSFIYDYFVSKFPNVKFEEMNDRAANFSTYIDYIGRVGNKAFGIQFTTTNTANLTDMFKRSYRMNKCFESFEKKYKGKVFTVVIKRAGKKKSILNSDIVDYIRDEIDRLSKLL